MTIALTVALVVITGLAAYMLSQRDKTISTLKGEVIIRTLVARETRAKLAKAERMLDDTELAAEVAREVIGSLEPMDDPPIYRAVADHEATILSFRKQIPNDLGGAS